MGLGMNRTMSVTVALARWVDGEGGTWVDGWPLQDYGRS